MAPEEWHSRCPLAFTCTHTYVHTHLHIHIQIIKQLNTSHLPPPTYRRKGREEVISTSRKFELKVGEQTCAVQLSRLLKWHRPGQATSGWVGGYVRVDLMALWAIDVN